MFFVAVMAASGYYVFTRTLEGGEYVKVPDVTMRPVTEAAFALAEQGLEIGKQSQVPDDRVPKYYVMVQRPAAGKVVRTGRKVYLTVSAGTEAVSPPNLAGKSLQQALDEIKRTSFAMGNVARVMDNSARDTVLGQDPVPARLASSSSRINLLVSDGPRNATTFMPNLYHMTIAEAERILAPFAVKFKPNKVDLPDQPVDVILDQQPAAGTLLQQGDLVVYTVRPSGGVALPDAQRKASQIDYVVPPSWFEREVRIDTIDRNGTRTTIFPRESNYVNGQPPRFAAGAKLGIPGFSFIDKATVEIYLDGQLVESHYFEGDKPPEVKHFNVQ